MSDVNWWLVGLALVLGFAVTLIFIVRRVSREVPVYAALGRGPAADAARFKLAPVPVAEEPEEFEPEPHEDSTAESEDEEPAAIEADEAADEPADTHEAAEIREPAELPEPAEPVEDDTADRPHGAGSQRVGTFGSVPSGWTVQGDEESKVYHTPESPQYFQTMAGVWFADEETAQRAGYTSWDAKST